MKNPPELREIRRVIPVMESRDLSAGRLTCVSLELYEDGAWLNLWIRTPDPTRSEPAWFRTGTPLRISARDDRGDRYAVWMGGGSGAGSPGDESRWRFGYMLSPAIAEDASMLRLEIRFTEDDAAADTDPKDPSAGREAVDRAVFTVPLCSE
jgi:hypothetical protein